MTSYWVLFEVTTKTVGNGMRGETEKRERVISIESPKPGEGHLLPQRLKSAVCPSSSDRYHTIAQEDCVLLNWIPLD